MEIQAIMFIWTNIVGHFYFDTNFLFHFFSNLQQHPPHKVAVPAHACAVLGGDAKSPITGRTGNKEQSQQPNPPNKPRSPRGRHLEVGLLILLLAACLN